MATININGTEHEVTTDGFGITYIDNLPIDEFIQSLSEEDMVWAAEHGMKLYMDDPAYVQDIIQRHEITDLE